MGDPTFSTVESLANGKKLYLVCNYRYELRNGDNELLYWSLYLKDIENFLRNYKNA